MQKPNKYLFYILALYPLFSFFFQQIISVRPNFFMGIVYFFFVLLIIITKHNIRFPMYLRFYGIFALYTIIGDLLVGAHYNQDLITGMFGIPPIAEYFIKNSILSSFFILIIIENTYFTQKFIYSVTKIFFGTVIIATAVIVVQVFFPTFFLNPKEYDLAVFLDVPRRFSIFSWINTNESGYSFPSYISILLSMAFIGLYKKSISFYFFLSIIYATLTGGRYVILSGIIIFLQYFIYKKFKLYSIAKYIIASLILIFMSYTFLKFINVPIDDYIVERIFELDKNEFENTTAYSRILAIQLFSEFFFNQPILGTGGVMEYDLIKFKGSRTSQIHIGWLSLFYYYGIVGGILFLGFTYLILKRLLFSAKITNYWGSYFIFLTFFISILGTQVMFSINFMGFIFAMVFNRYFEQKFNSINDY